MLNSRFIIKFLYQIYTFCSCVVTPYWTLCAPPPWCGFSASTSIASIFAICPLTFSLLQLHYKRTLHKDLFFSLWTSYVAPIFGVSHLLCNKYLHITQTLPHCNENPIYVFLSWELRGLSPNFHIHVSVSDLYVHSQDRSTYFLQQNRQIDPGNI